MSVSLEMKGGANVARCEFGRKVASAFHDEHVMAIACKRVAFRERVIDEDRDPERGGHKHCDVECRILVRAKRCPCPVEDVASVQIGCGYAERRPKHALA